MRNNIQTENVQLAHLGFQIKKNALLYFLILSYFEFLKERAFIAHFASLDLSSSRYCMIKK